MKVNISNYEIWIIDYFDGKLNAEEIAELMAFIAAYPKISEEFEAFENVSLEKDITAYDEKKELKKKPIHASDHITEENYEEFFVAYHEGDLLESERLELLSFIDVNPSLKNEFNFHKELLVKEAPAIIYNNKAGLKRKAAIVFYWQMTGMAATILLLFGLFNFIDNSNTIGFREATDRQILSSLLPLSADITLQQATATNIITKQIKYHEAASVQNELVRNESPAFQKLYSKSTEISIVSSIDHVQIANPGIGYFDTSQVLAKINEPKRKNAFGRVIQNLSRKLTGNTPEQEEVNENEPSFVKTLGRTITVFNTITGSDTEMVKAYDQNGKLTGYYVEGETIAWGRNITPNNE